MVAPWSKMDRPVAEHCRWRLGFDPLGIQCQGPDGLAITRQIFQAQFEERGSIVAKMQLSSES